MPLPDYPMRWMKREDAIKEGYLPFAGFFLPHEYPMISGFILDLERAKREYCGVRDLKYAKGCEIFAKNGIPNPAPSYGAKTEEGIRSLVSHKNASGPRLTEGVREAPEGESGVRAPESSMASGEDRS